MCKLFLCVCVEILIRVTELKSVKQSAWAAAFEHRYLYSGSTCGPSAPSSVNHRLSLGGSPKSAAAVPVCRGMKVFRPFPKLTSILQTDVRATAALRTRL